MAEFDDLRLSQFWDALAAGQPVPSDDLDSSLTDPLRQVHALFHAPQPGSARERARQRLIDSTTTGANQPMSASTIPIGFPSANGHKPPVAVSKPAIPISTRQRPRWVLAAIAATLALLLGSLGAFFVSQRDTHEPIVPAVVQSPEGTASPWSQYRNGPGHTGTTSDLGPETNPGTLWTFQTGESINSEAAIVDGIAYIGSGDGNLYALDAATGAEKWKFDSGAAVDCGPAVANGVVYVTTRNDELIAVSTDDGSEQWRFAKANSNASAVLDGENLYLAGNDGKVYALDPATGQERWSFATGLTTGRTPAATDGVLVAGTEEGTLFAIDTTDGTQKWSFASKGGLMSTTVIDDGTVYQAVGGGDGNGLYALDLQTGKERWDYHTLDNEAVGVPTADGNTVYFTADDGRLYALDTSNGTERWLVTKTAPWQADGKVAGNFFYIYHSQEGKLFAFDKTSGAVQWEVDGVEFAAKGPSISGGVLYASTPDGLVSAVAADAPGALGAPTNTPASPVAAATNATLLWSTNGDASSPLDEPLGVAIAPDGTIWVANGGANNFEIFSPDGEFIRTWGANGTEPGQFMFTNPKSQGGVLGNVDWDADGNIYVFDTYNARVQKFDPDGTFLLQWKIEGPLPEPLGVVDGATGRVYVTNTDENRIEVYDLNGTLIDQFGQSGNDPGEFHLPYGIAIGQDGNVYVAEHDSGRIQVFDKFGNLQTSRDDGGVLLTNAGEIYYMDVDAAGRLYAADYRHGKLLVIAPDGTVLTEIGEIDGLGSLALVSGVAVAPDGSVYLTNEDNWLAKVQIALPE